MPKLTASQVAAKVGVTAYTIKRWYDCIEKAPMDYLQKLVKEGMPVLPKFETVGSMGWRYWEESDIPALIEFKNWVPKTKNGIFKKLKGDIK